MHTVTTLPLIHHLTFRSVLSKTGSKGFETSVSTASRNIVSSHSWNVEVGPHISTYNVDEVYAEDNNNQEGFLNYWGLEDQTVNY